ncbi:MAG: nucleoside-diphosphate sugar epimerase/dehydratase [Rikenellaceae bacterium]
MAVFDKIASRISGMKIVNRWAILFVDTALSSFISFLILAFVSTFIYNINDQIELRIWLTNVMLSGMIFLVAGTHKMIVRHFSVLSIIQLVVVSIIKVLLLMAIVYFRNWELPLKIIMVVVCLDAFMTAFALIMIRVSVIVIYDLSVARLNTDSKHVLMYGIDSASVAMAQSLAMSKQFRLVGFVNPDPSLMAYKLADMPVCHFDSAADLENYKQTNVLHGIIFPDNKSLQDEANRLVMYSQETGTKNYVIPSVDELDHDGVTRATVKEIQIEDLLGRSEIHINMKSMYDIYQGKTILVTGAAGSIGSELCRQLAGVDVKKLVLYDNAETPLHSIRLELEQVFPELDFVPFMGDVRSANRLTVAFEQFKPDFVFHAAAYKHVPLMEENPCEAVRVNITGTRLVAEHCVRYGVEKMVMVSTDKAVNPTNVMGASKRLAEIYVQSLGLAIERGEVEGHTKFVTTRFGNVLGSNGSVIPYFRKQIADGGPVTVTHPDITRYFMTIPEACRLVMEAANIGANNQILIFDMGTPIKIADLAKRMIELAGLVPDEDIKIKYTGLRPGEKLYEELLSNDENTIPTSHNKIRIAKVRDYIYADVVEQFYELDRLAVNVDIDSAVRLMKDVVPEYISKNSVFEKMDVKS